MEKKNIVVLAIILLILFVVGSFFVVNLMRGRVYDRVPDPSAMPTDSIIGVIETPIEPNRTVEPGEEPAETNSATEEFADPAMLADMDKIEVQVAELRGLEIEQRIPRRLMDSAELKETVLNDFLEDYDAEDEAQDVAILRLFGLLPEEFALRQFYLDLYSEQIAGFYDTDEKAMYVVSDAGFGGMERSTYAHEFVHVLQDEHFNFDDKLQFSDEYCQEDSERCLAIQALIEGDASLTQALWFQAHSTQQDIKDLTVFYQEFQSPILDSAPAYMQSDFTFPYLSGAEFVQSLYAKGGFELIDQAFQSQPPVSTEQILHPGSYPEEIPNNPDLPDLATSLGQGWEVVDENILGEWYTYLVLAKGYEAQYRLQDAIALDASEGWGGDRYAVLKNESTGELTAAVSFNWDTTEDAQAALNAFGKYADLRFGTIKAQGYWQGETLYSSLSPTSETSFVWILAESTETLLAMQAVLYN